MDPSELLKIGRDWSYWDGAVPASIPRHVELPDELRPDLALVIQGVRRCGKSTLLGQLMTRYGLDPSRCLFVNFEDPRLANALDYRLLQGFMEAFEEDRGPGCTFFLDEIQHVEGWERWLRGQLDRPADRRFVVTGSNAHLLSGELASSLTGRYLAVELFPFDLEEFRLVRPEANLAEYLDHGGFPAPLTMSDGDRLLRSYFNDILERDVRERVGARSTRPLRHLGQMLFESAGAELSVRRLAGAIGLASDTTSLYLQAIESAYLAFSCPFFAWSERKRSARNKKYYPVDTGLRRAAVTRTGHDLGKMLECATFLLLRKHFRDVYYWRGKGEVDFVVQKDGQAVPIQVTWEEPSERHDRALREFYEIEPHSAEAVFVTPEVYEQGIPTLLPTP